MLKKKMPIAENDVRTIEPGSLTVADGVTLTVNGKLETKTGTVGKALLGEKGKAARAEGAKLIVNGTIVVEGATATLTIGETALVGTDAALTLGCRSRLRAQVGMG